ncbi:hypothetical protein F5X99DRAFT_375878 [Biscogniauxia marginata]|nr:hypothetical protein F5X99DRAFT_375878 [Biscogniauxia marginata]
METCSSKMAPTFLHSLTLANPKVDSSESKEGKSTKTSRVYGPHDCKLWADVTWENLEATFGEVLRQEVHEDRTRDANDAASVKTDILEEGSVITLTHGWNEKVVQRALDGTRDILMKNQLKGPLSRGVIHFTKNDGEGHIPNELGNLQKPDWCVYQKKAGDKAPFGNIVPGDCKPAKKWKSEWINSDDERLKQKARRVVQQITKYMYLGKTRYGFVISEEELVPVRLSMFHRQKDALEGRIIADHQEQQIADTSEAYGEGDEPYNPCSPEIPLEPGQTLGVPFINPGNRIRLLLEYCQIPWTASGSGRLPLLAIQDSSIKGTDTYTSLGEITRGGSPVFEEQEHRDKIDNNTILERQTRARKRRAKTPAHPITGSKRSKSQRNSMHRDQGDMPVATRSQQAQFEGYSRGGQDETVRESIFTRSFASSHASSSGSRRSTRKKKGNLGDSFNSIASTSQSAEGHGSFAWSFQSS